MYHKAPHFFDVFFWGLHVFDEFCVVFCEIVWFCLDVPASNLQHGLLIFADSYVWGR